MDNEVIEVIKETKHLGVIVTDNLSRDTNTMSLVTRANARMRLLHKLVNFGVSVPDLVNIYVLYVRSILKQSCQVWHSSLTQEKSQNLERVQKTAMKIILQNDYQSYHTSLEQTGLSTLSERRSKLCLSFAKKCLKHPEMKLMFPINTQNKKTRCLEKINVINVM